MATARKGKNYQTERVKLDARFVKQAIVRARLAKDSTVVCDSFDEELHYWLLRQRGHALGWFVRAKGKTIRIGSVRSNEPNYLKPDEARKKAGKTYYDMTPGGGLGWTWADLDREYCASKTRPRLGAKGKVRHPVKDSHDEIQRHFHTPEFASWQNIKLTDLTAWHLRKLLDQVHKRNYYACVKTCAYVKAALSWAQGEKTLESGLGETPPWWKQIKPPQPNADEIVAMEHRQKKLTAAKSTLTMDHLAELLVVHEQFCTGREGNQKISPGIHWGIWWLVLTANRRFTTTQLRRDDLNWVDAFNPHSAPDRPWGTASWPPDSVKAKLPFMLPIPPIGLYIAGACMSDWLALITKKRGFRSCTQWVFASTRRQARKGHPENPDPSIYRSSINGHLRALAGRKQSSSNKVNLLGENFPQFWPHLIRSVTTNFFDSHRGTLPAAAASAMLGHVLPSDYDIDWRKMSKTTIEYYLTAQHMDLKIAAMKLWSDALMKAYFEAGGIFPLPSEPVSPTAAVPAHVLRLRP